MKTNFNKIEESIYTPKIKSDIDKVETISEHEILKFNIDILIDENKIHDDNNLKIEAIINKSEFKKLFGPDSKPRKGDVVDILGLSKKFKVKKSKKFSAKKKGKGYKVSLKTV